MSLPSLSQCLWALVIIFIIYAVLTDPTGAASVTNNAWDHIKDGFGAVTTFFDGVLSD